MKLRNDISNSRKAALLGGAMLMAMLPGTAALAEDANGSNWYSNGELEAGSNFFIQKPGSGFGKTSSDPFWLTPNTSDSNAKMDEYGKVPRSVFLDKFDFNAGTKDGRFAVDLWADHVGMDNQSYYMRLYEPGRQYFNMGWDQTPHLLSSSAKSIFGGVGSSHLTVDPATRTFLQPLGQTNSQTTRNQIDTFINNSAPIENIELKTLREKFTASYRNTMWDNWDFNFDYAHEHRTGNRPLGIGYGVGSANPRPSSGSIEVPQPIDDKTQNFNGAGEFVGDTPWGTKWNTSLKYSGSYYDNSIKSFDVDNPFCITCNGTGAGAAPFGPNTLRYGLAADNHVNGLTWNTSIDLPMKTRYTSNVQYMMFRQNDPFINTTSNGQIAIAPYPASSLNGEVNTFLTNNVIYSHLTHDLTNTARVRYYDRKDNTPTITFANYALADTGTATTLPLTRNPHSYSKLNLEDDLKWQANRTWAFGLGYFFERYIYENGEVDSTNESGAKAFVNLTPWSWFNARSSVQYSERRYNTYLAITGANEANANRLFFVQNRNRTKASTVVELQVFRNVSFSPNGGLRWDEYPTDAWLNNNGTTTTTLGLHYDRSWNAGADLGVRLSPELRMTFGYNHEEHDLSMESCCGGSATTVPLNDANKWKSDIIQKYDTFMVSTFWNAMPGKLDFEASYLIAASNEANNTTGCTSNNTSCTGKNFATDPAVVWPDEHNQFQRFSILAKYYVDPMVVKQMGWFGDVTAKLRYTWEQNKNSNWATDNFSPYSPSAADAGGTDISNGGRSLFLAYNNPNYTAQIITASINWKW